MCAGATFVTLEVVKLLLDRGADMLNSNEEGWTPLYSAAASGHVEVVKLLLVQGAYINSKYICDATPLCKAISDGKEDLMDIFIKRGADLWIAEIYGRTLSRLAKTSGISV